MQVNVYIVGLFGFIQIYIMVKGTKDNLSDMVFDYVVERIINNKEFSLIPHQQIYKAIADRNGNQVII